MPGVFGQNNPYIVSSVPHHPEVDGGINEQTVRLAAEAGADVMVAGSSCYGAPDGVEAALARLVSSAEGKV